MSNSSTGFKAGFLRSLKGLWRVTSVPAVVQKGNDLNIQVELCEIRPDAGNLFTRDARVGSPPIYFTPQPHWLSVLTYGSIWKGDNLVLKPQSLDQTFEIDTQHAELRRAETGHINVWAPILDSSIYSGLLIPSPEILRFYLGSSSQLIAKALRGQLESLVAAEEIDYENGHITIYTRARLSSTEAKVLGRLRVNSYFKNAIYRVHNELMKANVTNKNSKKNPPLSINANFPFEGLTNLKISGKEYNIEGTNKKGVFVFEIYSCSSPYGYSSLSIERPDDIGPGGEKTVDGKHPIFSADDRSDIDYPIDDTSADKRLPRLAMSDYGSSFPASDNIVVYRRRSQNQRDWKAKSPRIQVETTGLTVGDGTHESMAKGKVGADYSKENPPPPSSRFLSLFSMLGKFNALVKSRDWKSESRELNGLSSLGNVAVTFFPVMSERRLKWHLILNENAVHRRQIACIEVEIKAKSKSHPGHFIYIMEMELKGESGCSIGLVRWNDLRQLDTDTLNNLLKLTIYSAGWPDILHQKWSNSKAVELANRLRPYLLIGKSRHPNSLENWHVSLLKDIDDWLSS